MARATAKKDNDRVLDEIRVLKSEPAIVHPSKRRIIIGAVAAAVVSLLLVALTNGFKIPAFADEAGAKALTALGTLFIISLFVERAQQVYIAIWRGLRRTDLDNRVLDREKLLANATGSTPPDPATVMEARNMLHAAVIAQETYKANTRKLAFISGMVLGLLIAIAGARILSEVFVFKGEMDTIQQVIFNFADILITGGLIGGGSEGIHKIIALITEFLDSQRAGLRKQVKDLGTGGSV
ncbi:MAG: hypothetical protein HQ483_04735 [Rhodospirillales bacterium]|nr:hypothetical protein [Rhodospirillales bacterium]